MRRFKAGIRSYARYPLVSLVVMALLTTVLPMTIYGQDPEPPDRTARPARDHDSAPSWSDSISVEVSSGDVPHVGLISDLTELSAITPVLDGMSLTYDVLNNNWNGSEAIYTSDYSVLENYDVVVWYGSGDGSGRLTTPQEYGALHLFLQTGKRLLVTGYDTLGHPTDPLLADLIRSSSTGDSPFTFDYTITDGSHPIADGPYGTFPTGTALTAGHSDHDQAEADAARNAVTVAELTGGRDKIIATDLDPANLDSGRVVYWNGNRNAVDWTGASMTIQEEDKEHKPEAEITASGALALDAGSGSNIDLFKNAIVWLSERRGPVLFCDDFESGMEGWATTGFWHLVQDGVSPYPNSHSPTHSWWYGQDATGDYDNGTTNSGNLTSPLVDLPNQGARICFWNWYETEHMIVPQSVYFDIYHDTDGTHNISGGVYTDWATDLVGAGWVVDEYNQAIDLATLVAYEVLALFDPEVSLTAGEITAINNFLLGGGRVVVLGEWGDIQGVNTNLNTLTTLHGITLNSDVVEDPTNNDGMDFWPLIHNFADESLVKGVATVVLYAGASLSLSGPAVPLASGDGDTYVTPYGLAAADAGDGDEDGKSLDLPSQAHETALASSPVVMAVAPVGAGQLIAIGDSNLWSNTDPDADGTISLEEYNNSLLSRLFFGKMVDNPAWDQKWVQMSVDGSPFQNLVQVTGGPMSEWLRYCIDLPAYGGGTVQIRFHFDTGDAMFNDYRGWYVDDFCVAPWRAYIPLGLKSYGP